MSNTPGTWIQPINHFFYDKLTCYDKDKVFRLDPDNRYKQIIPERLPGLQPKAGLLVVLAFRMAYSNVDA
jgi:hypothetical protein